MQDTAAAEAAEVAPQRSAGTAEPPHPPLRDPDKAKHTGNHPPPAEQRRAHTHQPAHSPYRDAPPPPNPLHRASQPPSASPLRPPRPRHHWRSASVSAAEDIAAAAAAAADPDDHGAIRAEDDGEIAVTCFGAPGSRGHAWLGGKASAVSGAPAAALAPSASKRWRRLREQWGQAEGQGAGETGEGEEEDERSGAGREHTAPSAASSGGSGDAGGGASGAEAGGADAGKAALPEKKTGLRGRAGPWGFRSLSASATSTPASEPASSEATSEAGPGAGERGVVMNRRSAVVMMMRSVSTSHARSSPSPALPDPPSSPSPSSSSASSFPTVPSSSAASSVSLSAPRLPYLFSLVKRPSFTRTTASRAAAAAASSDSSSGEIGGSSGDGGGAGGKEDTASRGGVGGGEGDPPAPDSSQDEALSEAAERHSATTAAATTTTAVAAAAERSDSRAWSGELQRGAAGPAALLRMPKSRSVSAALPSRPPPTRPAPHAGRPEADIPGDRSTSSERGERGQGGVRGEESTGAGGRQVRGHRYSKSLQHVPAPLPLLHGGDAGAGERGASAMISSGGGGGVKRAGSVDGGGGGVAAREGAVAVRAWEWGATEAERWLDVHSRPPSAASSVDHPLSAHISHTRTPSPAPTAPAATPPEPVQRISSLPGAALRPRLAKLPGSGLGSVARGGVAPLVGAARMFRSASEGGAGQRGEGRAEGAGSGAAGGAGAAVPRLSHLGSFRQGLRWGGGEGGGKGARGAERDVVSSASVGRGTGEAGEGAAGGGRTSGGSVRVVCLTEDVQSARNPSPAVATAVDTAAATAGGAAGVESAGSGTCAGDQEALPAAATAAWSAGTGGGAVALVGGKAIVRGSIISPLRAHTTATTAAPAAAGSASSRSKGEPQESEPLASSPLHAAPDTPDSNADSPGPAASEHGSTASVLTPLAPAQVVFVPRLLPPTTMRTRVLRPAPLESDPCVGAVLRRTAAGRWGHAATNRSAAPGAGGTGASVDGDGGAGGSEGGMAAEGPPKAMVLGGIVIERGGGMHSTTGPASEGGSSRGRHRVGRGTRGLGSGRDGGGGGKGEGQVGAEGWVEGGVELGEGSVVERGAWGGRGARGVYGMDKVLAQLARLEEDMAAKATRSGRRVGLRGARTHGQVGIGEGGALTGAADGRGAAQGRGRPAAAIPDSAPARALSPGAEGRVGDAGVCHGDEWSEAVLGERGRGREGGRRGEGGERDLEVARDREIGRSGGGSKGGEQRAAEGVVEEDDGEDSEAWVQEVLRRNKARMRMAEKRAMKGHGGGHGEDAEEGVDGEHEESVSYSEEEEAQHRAAEWLRQQGAPEPWAHALSLRLHRLGGSWESEDVVVVDHRGRPVARGTTGGHRGHREREGEIAGGGSRGVGGVGGMGNGESSGGEGSGGERVGEGEGRGRRWRVEYEYAPQYELLRILSGGFAVSDDDAASVASGAVDMMVVDMGGGAGMGEGMGAGVGMGCGVGVATPKGVGLLRTTSGRWGSGALAGRLGSGIWGSGRLGSGQRTPPPTSTFLALPNTTCNSEFPLFLHISACSPSHLCPHRSRALPAFSALRELFPSPRIARIRRRGCAMLDDDVFDDVDGGGADFREWDREAQVRRDNFVKLGYRDGITAGKEAAAQEGFNAGFRESCAHGFRWGHARGLASVLSSLPPDVASHVRLPSAPRHCMAQLARAMALQGGDLAGPEGQRAERGGEAGGGGGGSEGGVGSAEAGARAEEESARVVTAALAAVTVGTEEEEGEGRGPSGGEGGSTEQGGGASGPSGAPGAAQGGACVGSSGTAAVNCCGGGVCGSGTGSGGGNGSSNDNGSGCGCGNGPCEAGAHASCACQRASGGDCGGTAVADSAADGAASVEHFSHGLVADGAERTSVAGEEDESVLHGDSLDALSAGGQGGERRIMDGEAGDRVDAVASDSVSSDAATPGRTMQGECHLATAMQLVSSLHASMHAPAHPVAAAAGDVGNAAAAVSGDASVPAGSMAQAGRESGAAEQAERITLWRMVGEGVVVVEGVKVGGDVAEGGLAGATAASVVQGVHASVVAGVAALLGDDEGRVPEGPYPRLAKPPGFNLSASIHSFAAMELAAVASACVPCPKLAAPTHAAAAAGHRCHPPISSSSITAVGVAAIRGKSTSRSRSATQRNAGAARAAMAPTEYAEGERDTPEWTGETTFSRMVNAVIGIKPLYDLMKIGARQVLISTAEKSGVPWRKIAEELQQSPELVAEKEALENKDIVYPEYYVQPFHAYDQGNLCWEAAYEVEAATLSMCRRAIPWADSAEEAARILRLGWLDAIQAHHAAHAGGAPVQAVLDVGCSVGVSTRWLASYYPEADVTGLDASAYFLAVASLRAKQQQQDAAVQLQGGNPAKPIRWVHALGEDTDMPSNSFDLISFAFVFHECPPDAIRGLLAESKRLLKPGGTVSFTDNSPKSKIIQNLPAPVAALMKSTEPHSDSYYLCNLEGMMKDLGFTHVTTVLSDPRHRTVTATA
ncbi:unnamed protein product [Closterium sp. Yama58-4]|nr:unnamed protein product [Closterium sp. Yama58-4]